MGVAETTDWLCLNNVGVTLIRLRLEQYHIWKTLSYYDSISLLAEFALHYYNYIGPYVGHIETIWDYYLTKLVDYLSFSTIYRSIG